jgi:hypothetical protein
VYVWELNINIFDVETNCPPHASANPIVFHALGAKSHTDRQADSQIDRQIDIDIQTNRQAYRQTDRQK